MYGYRINKRENPYLQVDKTGINDTELSFRATGLLVYLLSLPVGWKLRIEHLATVKKDGKAACKSALKELREHNYCHYYEIRQSGRVVKTFYDFYEVPTPFDETKTDEILEELGFNKESYTVCFKYVNGNPEKSTFSPKTEKPIAVKPIAANHSLQINNNTKKEIYKENHIHEEHDPELDFFEKLFKGFGIKFTKTNQESIKRLLKKQKQEEVKQYLVELYTNLKNNKEVLNLAAVFTVKLKKGERQLKFEKNKASVVEVKEITETEAREKIKYFASYFYDKYRIGGNREKVLAEFCNSVDNYILSHSKLVEEYYNKLEKLMNNK